MSDTQTDPDRVWATGFVERAIEQPVKRAVREALDEYDAERAASRSDENVDDDVDADSDDGVVEAIDSTTVNPLRLLLLAGALAGVSYAAMRRRGQDADDEADTTTDEDVVAETSDVDESADADDFDADDAIPEGDRPTAPVEDATTN